MSPAFIILYAGAPVRFPALDMVDAQAATVFASEADARAKVRRHHLTVRYCRVVELNKFIELGLNQTSK
jgi:hypothetical protein